MSRVDYWNKDYLKYWMKRVGEANTSNIFSSTLVENDVLTPADQTYLDYIKSLDIQKDEDVVEIAVGFGRSLPLLSELANRVVALDISEEMIEMAKTMHKNDNIEFYVSPSESTPLSDCSFDVAICFAAFDAMYQSEALLEINRICKKGARVLLTGKNDNFLPDDDQAINAEIGARRKGHPNFFTDVARLKNLLENFGFTLEKELYYPRRGDFGSENYVTEIPEFFYEWSFFFSKSSQASIDPKTRISDVFSKTYKSKMVD